MSRHAPRRWFAMLVIAASVILGGVMGTLVAWAYFSDPGSSQANTFTAGTITPPADFQAVMISTTTASLSWTAPNPANLTGYALTSQPTGGVTGCSIDSSPSATSCVVSGLTPGMNYTWTLEAVYDSWTSFSVTTPSVAFTFPLNNTTYGDDWGGVLTGTASTIAGSGTSITDVAVSLQQGSGASTCWTGSGSAFTASCPNLVAATGTASWSLALPATDLTSGDSYTVISEATDSAGNVGTSAATFTYNTTAPSVSVSFPTNGADYNAAAWTGGAPIAATLTSTASTINAGTIKLTITQSSTGNTWNGTAFVSGPINAVSPSTYDPGMGAFTYSFPSSNFPDTYDTYSVSVSATDGAGNVGTGSATFSYDTTTPVAPAPIVSATAMFGSNPVWVNNQSGESVTLSDVAADPGGPNVASVAYYYCAASSGSCTSSTPWNSIGSSSTGASFLVTWNSLPADGQYNVVAVATGQNTNMSNVSTATLVGVDTTGPLVAAPTVTATVHYVNGGILFVNNGAVVLTDPATDSGSGEASVAYYYCGASVPSCTSSNGTEIGSPTSSGSNYSVTSGVPLAPDGPYQIVAAAIDNVGNVSTSLPTLVTVDTTVPTVSTPSINGFS